jgi:RNA polymerase sigma-70 factor, ECF subfamily
VSVTGRLSIIRESSVTFEELYVREFGAIVALAYALSGSRTAAEDLAQEAFIAAHRNWETVADLDAPGAWVRRVVANMSVSAFRRGIAEAKALTRVALGHQQVVPELSADDAEFWRAVRSLPRRQAQVIALRYLEDLPIAEIAQILGTSDGTVKKHLHDGRATDGLRHPRPYRRAGHQPRRRGDGDVNKD